MISTAITTCCAELSKGKLVLDTEIVQFPGVGSLTVTPDFLNADRARRPGSGSVMLWPAVLSVEVNRLIGRPRWSQATSTVANRVSEGTVNVREIVDKGFELMLNFVS